MSASHQGQLVYAKGFGARNMDSGASVEKETTFCLGATSMQFTGAAALLLIRRKKLAFDDELSDFVPADLRDRVRGIKVKHLLMLTSGLPPPEKAITPSEDVTTRPWPVEQQLREALRSGGRRATPGTPQSYQGLEFNLLGLIIERVSGTSYFNVLRKQVLDPLKMSATRYYGLPRQPDSALGYSVGDRDYTYVASGNDTDPTWLSAAGGIVSNAVDLQRWDQEVHKLIDYDAPDLLAMHRRVANPGNGRTAGFFGWQRSEFEGDLYLYSEDVGVPVGFQSMNVILVKSKISVSVLINTADGGDITTAPFDVARRVVLALRGR